MLLISVLIHLAQASVHTSFSYRVNGQYIRYDRSEKNVSLTSDKIAERYTLSGCEQKAFVEFEKRILRLASAENPKKALKALDKSQVVEFEAENGKPIQSLKSEPLGELLLNMQAELLKTKITGEQLCKK
jgi:hypothetical protein